MWRSTTFTDMQRRLTVVRTFQRLFSTSRLTSVHSDDQFPQNPSALEDRTAALAFYPFIFCFLLRLFLPLFSWVDSRLLADRRTPGELITQRHRSSSCWQSRQPSEHNCWRSLFLSQSARVSGGETREWRPLPSTVPPPRSSFLLPPPLERASLGCRPYPRWRALCPLRYAGCPMPLWLAGSQEMIIPFQSSANAQCQGAGAVELHLTTCKKRKENNLKTAGRQDHPTECPFSPW